MSWLEAEWSSFGLVESAVDGCIQTEEDSDFVTERCCLTNDWTDPGVSYVQWTVPAMSGGQSGQAGRRCFLPALHCAQFPLETKHCPLNLGGEARGASAACWGSVGGLSGVMSGVLFGVVEI